MYLGGKPVESPFLEISQIFAILYFSNFIFIVFHSELFFKNSWKPLLNRI
jgi:hypothetical protein